MHKREFFTLAAKNQSRLDCSCNDWGGEAVATCIRFYEAAEVEAYGLNVAAICVPECVDIAECQRRFGTTYTRCAMPVHMSSEETIGAAKTCLP